jgi:hypothetical protein
VGNLGSFIALWSALIISIAAVGQSSALSDPLGHVRDVGRVRTGIFEYLNFNHGKLVGSATLTIRKLADSGNLKFVSKADFVEDFSGFRSQRWEAVTSPDFRPILAKLAFLQGNEVVPKFELRYTPNRVAGFVIQSRDVAHGARETVDARVPAGIVDQRVDWAAILASDLKPGEQIEFNVFDPGTGISRVVAGVGPAENLLVGAGAFRAFRIGYRMEKPNKTERFQLFVTQALPHLMLREDFPNGVRSLLAHIAE